MKNNREKKSPLLRYQDTYIYIDVSNIRAACLKTLGFRLDFVKLFEYFRKKYPNLKDVRYYEGIARGDQKKRQQFEYLEEKGYTICALERKLYSGVEIEKYTARCPNCRAELIAELTRERRAMKSNVDVYLASDMLVRASTADHPVRLILVSCDGDYAEAIRNILKLNKDISVSVLATPFTRDIVKNTVSVRLRKLMGEFEMSRYMLHDINNIQYTIAEEE